MRPFEHFFSKFCSERSVSLRFHRSTSSKTEQPESDEIVEPGIPAALGMTNSTVFFDEESDRSLSSLVQSTRSIASASSTHSSQTRRSSVKSKKLGSSQKGYFIVFLRSIRQFLFSFSSSVDGSQAGSRRDRPGRARTRDEIYGLYCTFGEQPSTSPDFLAKILNILRDATEGLLSHAEVK